VWSDSIGFDFWFLFKWAIVAFSFMYFLFSLIVMRQIRLMTDTLITNISPIIRAFGVIHAIFALILILVLIIS
jgi:hypothetical protein